MSSCAFSDNAGSFIEGESYQQPKLFELTSDLFTSSTYSQTLAALTLTANAFGTAESPITFDMHAVILSGISATSNVVNSLFRVVYKSAAASLTVDGGSFDSTAVNEGAVFDLRESDAFARSTATPSTMADGTSFAHFLVKNSASFASNAGPVLSDPTQSGPKTSCLLVTGDHDAPWYVIRIQDAAFDFNAGSVTNEIFFDASVLSIEISACSFQIDISGQNVGKMAQVLYKPSNSATSLSVHDSTFSCENLSADVDEVIFKYDTAAVTGRASVFRLGESINNEVLEQITTETARNADVEEGLRDGDLFTMQFADNTFAACHHMHKGAIYYLEEGARMRD